jgi:hypothetical protein
MKIVIRVILILITLAEATALARFAIGLRRLGNAFGGSGDGIGSPASLPDDLIGYLLIGAIGLFLGSPYVLMAASSLNVIKGKARRWPLAYSLVMIALITLSLIALLLSEIFLSVPLQHGVLFMTLGNCVILGLWIHSRLSAKRSGAK